jgi:hypothetical protein
MSSYSSTQKVPLGTTRTTGEKCPESGVWKTVDSPSTTGPFAKGNTFPPHNGRSVTWKLIQYA